MTRKLRPSPAVSSSSAGAKIVAKLAFNTIRSLQAAVAEQRRAAEAKAAELARLQATIEGLEAAAVQRDQAVSAAESKLAQVGVEVRGSVGCRSWHGEE